MACHFVRWNVTEAELDTHRLSKDLILSANSIAPKLRKTLLSSQVLLAELMFYLYGIPTLPEIITLPNGRSSFASADLPSFIFASAGNTVGVMLSSEGYVGLELEILHAHRAQADSQQPPLSAVEQMWISMQNDPLESTSQLFCIRQSALKLLGQNESSANTLTLHPASGRLRSSILPDVQVMSDIDGALTWACAHSPAFSTLLCWQYMPSQGFVRTQILSPQQQNDSPHFMKLTSLPPAK